MKKTVKAKREKVMKNKPDFTFCAFIKKLWWVIIILNIIPILALITFIVLMAKGVCNISDLGSMLGGLLAYIGTIVLGLVSVWQVERQRKENHEAILQQNFEQSKGVLQIYIEIINNSVVLVVKNMGKAEIFQGSVTFDEEWLKQIDDFGDIAISFKKSLLKSLSNEIYLASNQDVRFLIYYIGSDRNYYNFLLNNNCVVKISYVTLERTIEQRVDIDFHSVLSSYYGLNIEEEKISEIEKISKNQIKEIKNISDEIKKLNSNIVAVNNQLKDIVKKMK